MCGSPSSSGRPSSSGSSGPSAQAPSAPRSRRPDLRRFVLVFLLAYFVTWPVWLALAPAYGRLLAAAASGVIRIILPDRNPYAVTLIDRDLFVHAAARPAATGVRVDARSVHFNWLLLLPLLAATAAMGRRSLGARGAAGAIGALFLVHVGFLLGIAEYRLLRSEGRSPDLAYVLFAFSQFYYSVGRIGIPILIWLPVGAHAVLPPPPPAPPLSRAARRRQAR